MLVRQHPRRTVRGPDQGRAARASCACSPARCCAPRPPSRSATTTPCTPTTGSPARSGRSPATAGACRSCTRCTPWRRSRTTPSPRATPPSPPPGSSARSRWSRPPTCWSPTPTLEAKQLINLYDADAVPRRGGPPGRRPRGVPPARPGRRHAAGSACRPTRRCCCSPAGSSRSRPRRAAARGRGAARARARPALATGRPGRRWPVRHPASSTPSRWPSWPRSSASTAWCGSCRRWRRTSWPSWCAAADLVAVPSYNESFGLVAVEAQATGTPVVAAAVGGLTTVVRDGRSGLLVDGHRADDWADALRPARRRRRTCGRGSRRGALAQARAVLLGRAPPSGPSRSTTGRGRSCARPLPRPVHACPPPRSSATSPDRATSIEFDRERPTASSRFALPGEKKLQTAVRLDVGPHALGVPRVRLPRRPTRTTRRSTAGCCSGTCGCTPSSFAVDRLGDIYLDARLPLSSVTPDELDRLLGSVLTYADESFNTILELGVRVLDPQGVGVAQPARRVDRATSRRSAAGSRAAPTDPDQLATRTATSARAPVAPAPAGSGG